MIRLGANIRLDQRGRWVRQPRGVVFGEFSVVLVLALSILILCWNLWGRQELQQTMQSAALAMLNPNVNSGGGFAAFTTDSGGNLVHYAQSDPLWPPMLNNLCVSVADTIKGTTGLSSNAKHVRCAIQLAYLSIVTSGIGAGTVQAGALGVIHPMLTPETVCLPTGVLDPAYDQFSDPGNSTLISKMQTTRNNYVARSTGLKLLGPASQVQLYTNAPPTAIYFGWSPFITWACAGSPAVMGFSPSETIVSGVVVPIR